MRKVTVLLSFLLGLSWICSIALAQDTISPDNAADFIGQQKTVCGTVAQH